ncbi:MAG: DUF1800 domain-containing protein [Saprospiraceae bacterium]|nr:DUF1800 domain-containing protein [Saprospiraceae bacterium]
MIDCSTGSIEPFVPDAERPWNKQRVQHLYRRMGFGADLPTIEAALAQSPGALVDSIINNALAQPLSPQPPWAFWSLSNYQNQEQAVAQIFEWRRVWMRDMLNTGFRGKLTLFWHNHFVTRLETYGCPSYFYQYHKVLQEHALGNFREFTRAVGLTPAMLVFLNGVQNTRFSPNENYARELYELFTLGADNGYTQQDIVNTARALTGYNGLSEYCAPISFVQAFFDPLPKTIFGQTGNWGYNDVVNILFQQRSAQIAHYICSKIYRYFVSPQVDEDIVAQMAATFQANNFQLVPVFRQLFKSEHFFDDNIIGVAVKSPLELLLTFTKETSYPGPSDEEIDGLLYLSAELGQDLSNPPDVAGWQGNRSWINSNTLTGRWQAVRYIDYLLYVSYPTLLVNFAKNLSNDSNDAALVSRLITDHFLSKEMQFETDYERALMVFKAEIPENYYATGQWNLNWPTAAAQVALLLDHLLRKPDFQLF